MRQVFSVFGLAVILAATAWGAPSDIVWTDGVDVNPVVTEPGLTDANRAYYPSVRWDASANVWRAWFDASSGRDIGYGVSTDDTGTSFSGYALCSGFVTDRQSKPEVLVLGPTNMRMWYTANDRGGGYLIGTCVSTDGIVWTEDQIVNGLNEDDPVTFGPVERIAVAQLDDGSFVCYVRGEEPDLDPFWEPGVKILARYTSPDGINWTYTADVRVSEEFANLEFSSVVKHPDLTDTWYAWGNDQNGDNNIRSFISTDDGLTFTIDEDPVPVVGEKGTQAYNQERNFHAECTYMGNGQWVMFRSVSHSPHSAGIAWGVEENLVSGVNAWELF